MSHWRDFRPVSVLHRLADGGNSSELLLWLLFTWSFDSGFPESESPFFPPSWSRLSAAAEPWVRSWSRFASDSLWSLLLWAGVTVEVFVSVTTDCSPSWLLQSLFCSSVRCGGSGSPWSNLELLSWFLSCCCGRSAGTIGAQKKKSSEIHCSFNHVRGNEHAVSSLGGN